MSTILGNPITLGGGGVNIKISRVLDENVSYDGRKAVAAAGYDIVEESKNLLEYYTEVNEK